MQQWRRRLILLALLWCGAGVAIAADYVQLGTFTDPAQLRLARAGLERDGYPVVERLTTIERGRSAIILLVGPYDRIDQARYALNKLKEQGRFGTLRRYPDEAAPVVARPAAPSLEQPPPVTVEAAKPVTPPPAKAPTFKLGGFVMTETRTFPNDPVQATDQTENSASLVLQPEFSLGWNNERDTITFVPFLRAGDHDEERNHGDIRELMWLTADEGWELRLGIGKVFWGVTESQHLVDIINQVDLVENPDGEDKLGQPMVNLSLIRNWGTLDFFVLPGFRERTFPGSRGRFRYPLEVDTDQTRYESKDGKDHIDWAVRWSHYIGDLDISVSHFAGTGRTPDLRSGVSATLTPVLIPYYPQIEQTGLAAQWIAGGWAWKLEAISNKERDGRYTALTGGFEYTQSGLFGSAVDLGYIVEYLFDDRRDRAPTPFQDDVMLALRWGFNDAQSSEILMAAIVDAERSSMSTSIEASRRLGQRWKLGLEARWNTNVDSVDVLYPWRNDDYVQVDLGFYF